MNPASDGRTLLNGDPKPETGTRYVLAGRSDFALYPIEADEIFREFPLARW